MGASLVYLEKPNKDITFDEGEDSNVKFCAGSMQGWRINMVSSHSTRAMGVSRFDGLEREMAG
jgi:hypothetical protein